MRRRHVSPLQPDLDRTASEAAQAYSRIDREMRSAMRAVKKQDFRTAVGLAGNAAHLASSLHRALIEVEDIIIKMRQEVAQAAAPLPVSVQPELSRKV